MKLNEYIFNNEKYFKGKRQRNLQELCNNFHLSFNENNFKNMKSYDSSNDSNSYFNSYNHRKQRKFIKDRKEPIKNIHYDNLNSPNIGKDFVGYNNLINNK